MAHKMIGAVLLSGAVLLAACGGDERSPSAGRAEVAGTAGEHPTFGGGPPGGVLVVLADREPDHLNPLTYNSTPAYQAVHLMFRALAKRDSTLSGYEPDLARAWRMESDSVVVLELRDDVLWHDGTRVTAEDVVFTIERQRDPVTASPRQGDVAAVASVAARDSFTVEVRLNRTGRYAVNALLEVVPVPRHLLSDVNPAQMASAAFNRHPVGNGFYRFGQWNAGQSLVLEVNADRPEGRASIDRIVMRFIPDVNAAMTELLSGQGDLFVKVPPDQKGRIESSSAVRLYSGPRVRPAWLAWNTRVAPVDDARVRRAILMAVDREALAVGLFQDVGEPALTPIPPVLWEHSPSVRPIPHDPEGAVRLLAEAGWRDTNGDGIADKGGRPLRIEVDFISTDQMRQDYLVAMQAMLRRAGVELVPRAYESTAWVQRLRAGEFTGSLWGWGWGPGVVGTNAEMIFHSRSIPPNGANFAASRNPRIDQLIDSALVAVDTTRSRQIWRELEQLMIDDAVYAPLFMDPELFGVHARFRNVSFRGIEWWEDVPYWYVEPEERLGRDRVN